jgi:hypothetical protein
MFLGPILRVKLVLAMIAGMLFCTLATLEVPELLTLTDNTSNDYSLTAVQETSPPSVQRQAAESPRVRTFKISTPRRQSAARLQAVSFEPSVGDFLHSLCILRT